MIQCNEAPYYTVSRLYMQCIAVCRRLRLRFRLFGARAGRAGTGKVEAQQSQQRPLQAGFPCTGDCVDTGREAESLGRVSASSPPTTHPLESTGVHWSPLQSTSGLGDGCDSQASPQHSHAQESGSAPLASAAPRKRRRRRRRRLRNSLSISLSFLSFLLSFLLYKLSVSSPLLAG